MQLIKINIIYISGNVPPQPYKFKNISWTNLKNKWAK